MRKSVLTAVLAAILVPTLTHTPSLGAEQRLSGAEIQAAHSGKSYYGTTPSGNGFQIDYAADGSFKGIVPKDTDSGNWWVEGDRLCRRWNAWRERKPEECFTVAFDGKWARWYRADGSLYRAWQRGYEDENRLVVARNNSVARRLTGEEIARVYGGRRFYGQTAGGLMMLLDYASDGASKAVVEEGDTAAGLDAGVTVQGQWWVTGDTLCRRWLEWGDRHPEECFTVELLGDEAKWHRADGSLFKVFTIPG